MADDETLATLRELRTAVELLIQMLSARGALSAGEVRLLTKAALGARNTPPQRVRLSIVDDKYSVAPAEIDCASRIHLCKAVCCSYLVELSRQDVEEAKLLWHIDEPYVLKRGVDGYCAHFDRGGGGCTVHAVRPVACRQFDCRNNPRIWVDFEKRIPSPDLG